MGFFGLDILVVLLVLFGGGRNGGRDMLDMLPTDAYWQAKHVTVSAGQLEADAGPTAKPEHLDQLIHDLESAEFKTRESAKRKIYAMGPAALPSLKEEEGSSDPEVKTAATDLVRRLEAHEKEREIRRLMAIRTLGERKEKGAEELLKGLEGSKELFVGEYASRAVAEIEGKAFAAPDRREAVAGDLRVAPGEASIVGQCVGLAGAGQPMTVETLAEAALASAGGMPMGAADASKAPTKGEMIRRMTAGVLKVAERIGDVRFDGITLEVSKDVGPAGGSAVVVLRGEYDRDAVIEALEALQSSENAGPSSLKVTDDGGVKEIEEGEESMAALLPSNEQLVVIVGDQAKSIQPVKAEVLAALKGGKGTLEQNTAMGGLLKKVDRHSPLWVAAQLNAEMRKEKLFEGFETITLVTALEKAGVSFAVTGEGSDAELVKGSTEQLKTEIAGAITELQMAGGAEPRMATWLDFLRQLKVESAGTHTTLTGLVGQPMIRSMMQEAGPMMLMSGGSDDAEEGATTRP